MQTLLLQDPYNDVNHPIAINVSLGKKKLPSQLLMLGTPQEILAQKINEVHPQWFELLQDKYQGAARDMVVQ